MNARVFWVAPIIALIGLGTVWLGSPGGAQSTSDADYLKAVSTIYAVSKLGGFVKDWCDNRAPQTRAVTDKALAAWRAAFKLDEVEARLRALGDDRLERMNTVLEDKRDLRESRSEQHRSGG